MTVAGYDIGNYTVTYFNEINGKTGKLEKSQSILLDEGISFDFKKIVEKKVLLFFEIATQTVSAHRYSNCYTIVTNKMRVRNLK